MNNLELKNHILSFLRGHQLMSVATNGEHPWVANVYYAVDENLNLYFLSSPKRLHSKHIAQNPNVACAVYDSTQTPILQKEFVKIGVQLYGTAHLLVEELDIREGLEKWKAALGNTANDKFSFEKIQSGELESRLYRVAPKKVKLFHSGLFEEEDVPMLEL